MRATLERLFPSLPDAVMAQLCALVQRRTVGKGSALLCQGEVWDKAFVIERGLLRMAFTRRDGREFNKSFHHEDMLLCPITEAMVREGSLFSIHTVEPCELLQIPARELRACLGKVGAWEPLRTRLLERLVSQKLQREYHLLAMDGRTRYAHFCRTTPQLAARVPLTHLATYLGITDVSLSRIRRTARPAPN